LGNRIDRDQFVFRLRVEAENAAAQRKLDFVPRLAYSGKRALRGVAARFQDPVKFATRDNVKAGALLRQETDDSQVRICFQRKANLVIELGKRGIQSAVMVNDGMRAVNVHRRPVTGGDVLECHRLAAKRAFLVMKRMH
jgi:hypothetical protein